MLIALDPSSHVPPFEQIRAQVAAAAASGEAPVGTKLPTVRKLAEDLGLAVNTVAKAYRELETAGVVETRGRAGTVVAASGDRSLAEIARAAAAFAQRAKALGLQEAQARTLVETALHEAYGA
ncbi:GntR family transcriptional regulator [Streptacidiphilus jiangxiensis]|uniref:DNA-binding transcriptional regulator YhcF, GntR family n=1 Tax=Streptacidiphilus jiangxiensis TaxID=235985 RepID=A0A1H7FGZ9_STRJI|nr:GntR family transcriptional regulator [Streptacidiphilus jiangxiensis]SEK24527.1 DNA-binding transcriptional regulator YhcF, GntR family [Streptacidiphilus jiangxiensis]